MAHSLLWERIDAAEAEQLVSIVDIETLRSALGPVLGRAPSWLETGQQAATLNAILLDLYAYLIQFCRERHLTLEKTSTLFSIVHRTHTRSMQERLSDTASYQAFQQLLVDHSVHRPPFSCQIFTVADAQVIGEYVLETYYRHYKMYLYAFTPREVVSVRVVSGADRAQKPAVPKPLALAMTEEQWVKRKEAERLRIEEEEKARREQQQQASASNGGLKAARPEDTASAVAALPEEMGLKEQLEFIRGQVTQLTGDKLTALEAKIALLESRVSESAEGKKDPKKVLKKK
eukprot:TRINITY_DN30340_c0_g1_i1.p1 TRINITY_DN30340_c0_g1~~TRINITY_DN30340_c0_g1_i1.p1  ORF type:complete len:289 (+),score=74.29 TRINITY_DN30340_c0_g1_i1:65-931(+)